jgi:hypothetical protein
MSGEDVSVTFEGRKAEAHGGKQVFLLSAQAFHAPTGEQVASAAIPSLPRAGSPATETMQIDGACSKAGTAVLEQLRQWRRARASDGVPLLVTVLAPPPELDILLNKELRKACKRVTLQQSTTSRLVLKVSCTQDVLELVATIDETIRTWRPKAAFEFASKSRQAIIIQFTP